MPLRFPLVDALRGIAALLVLIYHVIEISGWQSFPSTGPALLFRIGWIGVDLFFVISGLVIGRAAIIGISTQPSSWKKPFFERRLRRIVPLYLLSGMVFLLLVDPSPLLSGWRIAAIHIASHLFFAHNMHPASHGSINGPNWSVGLEMQFYLAILFLGNWVTRTVPWKILTIWCLVALLWRFAAALFFAGKDAHIIHVATSQLPGVLDNFALGICLAKLAIAGRLAPNWRRFLVWASLAAALLATAWVLLFSVQNYWQNPFMVSGWRILLGAGLAALVAAAVTCPYQNAKIFLPLCYLGEISYGIYLWHLPVLRAMLEKTPWRNGTLLIATLTGVIALAAFSWHAFETKWIRRHQILRAP